MDLEAFVGFLGFALIAALVLWTVAGTRAPSAMVTLRRFETEEVAKEARQLLATAGIDSVILDYTPHYAPIAEARCTYLLSVSRDLTDRAERVLMRAHERHHVDTPPA